MKLGVRIPFSRFASFAFALGLLLGCEKAGPAEESRSGEIGQFPWGPGDGWVVGSEPVLSLGGGGGPEAQQFFRVQDALLLDSGVLWVADGATRELRVFGMDGRYIASYGGQGEGPGEFRSLSISKRIHGDSILVFDQSLFRCSVFAPSGEVARTTSVSYTVPLDSEGTDEYEGARVLPLGAFVDGRLYGVPVFPTRVRTEGPPGVRRDTLPIFLYSHDGVPISRLGRFAGDEYFAAGGSSMLLPFGHRLHLAAGDNRIAIGDGITQEITVLDLGPGPPTFFRRGWEAARISDRELEDYIEWFLARFDEGTRRSVARDLDRVPFPTQMPSFSSLLWDREGNLWVRRFRPPHRVSPGSSQTWDVFASDGTWLGAVDTPLGVQVTSIGADHLAGILRDELDLEHVVVHRLIKD
jgi:hypothetical protein